MAFVRCCTKMDLISQEVWRTRYASFPTNQSDSYCIEFNLELLYGKLALFGAAARVVEITLFGRLDCWSFNYVFGPDRILTLRLDSSRLKSNQTWGTVPHSPSLSGLAHDCDRFHWISMVETDRNNISSRESVCNKSILSLVIINCTRNLLRSTTLNAILQITHSQLARVLASPLF